MSKHTHHHLNIFFSGYEPKLIWAKNKAGAFFCCKLNSNLGVHPTWPGMSAVGQRSPGIPTQLLVAWMTTAEATTREPQREATGTTVLPTTTDNIAQRTAAAAPRKQSWRSRSQHFQRGRCAKPYEKNRVIDPKTGGCDQEIDSSIAVAVPPARPVLGVPLPTQDSLGGDCFL